MNASAKQRLVKILELSSLVIAAAVPLLFFLPIEKTIDQQAYSILIAGLLAWLSIILQPNKYKGYYNKPIFVGFGLFLGFSTVSAFFNMHLDYSFVGAPLVRIGLLFYWAILGIGLIVSRQNYQQLIQVLYLEIVVATLLSFPLSLITINSIDRVGGIFYQPDILGVVVGCGILLGLQIFRMQLVDNRLMYISLAYLTAILFATQARAPIFLTILLMFVWLATTSPARKIGMFWLMIAGISLIVGFVSVNFIPRISNYEFAKQSTSYRLDLVKEGYGRAVERPALGYGPGNLADALNCSYLKADELVATCDKNYFFNSSHNIFLDKFLAVGLIGGISYLTMIMLAIYYGLNLRPNQRILAYCIGLISLYYLTNVTSLVVEMLLIVLVIWIARQKTPSRASKKK